MILTNDNSDHQICRFLKTRRDLRFFDPKTAQVFSASPCDCCGTMSAEGDYITIEKISDKLSRTLQDYYSCMPYVESWYNDDTDEHNCENC